MRRPSCSGSAAIRHHAHHGSLVERGAQVYAPAAQVCRRPCVAARGVPMGPRSIRAVAVALGLLLVAASASVAAVPAAAAGS